MDSYRPKQHSIGKTIAVLRKERGWTQVELAERLQVSDKAISKWEQDNGAPSIEFFPALAELFGVSIDYLMTGKEVEKEVITMSRIELCAKNDDPSILDNFSFNSAHIKDETGKSLMDYVKQYNSHKVLTALINSCEYQTQYMALFPKNEFDLPELLELIKINRETIVLKNIDNNRTLKDVSDFGSDSLWGGSPRHINTQPTASTGYQNIFDYMVIHFDELSKEQKDFYFNLDYNSISYNTCWVYAYPYFVDTAYKSNKELFVKLIDKIFYNNKIYTETEAEIRKQGQYETQWIDRQLHNLSNNNALIYILDSTVLAAIENEDYELARKLNQHTKTKVEEDVFEQAKIRKNKNLSEEDKLILSCVHYGILNLTEILNTKNLPTIKKAIDKYPIHPVELCYDLYKQGNYRKLFEYSVDNELRELSDSIISANSSNIEGALKSICAISINYDGYPYYNSNVCRLRGAKLDRGRQLTLDKFIEYIKAYKQQVVSDATCELKKEEVITDLTAEYFENELLKGNSDMVIIKLCVRLEAVLRSNYHYEGDFSEMLNRYCNEQGAEDDGWGYNQEAAFVKYLQKLRKCRNSIVHSEKTQDNLSMDELRFCIDYICKMN